MAKALVDADDLAGLQAVGREAVKLASEAAAGPSRLLLALDTRRVAAFLADAELLGSTVPGRRAAAQQAASAQVLEAF